MEKITPQFEHYLIIFSNTFSSPNFPPSLVFPILFLLRLFVSNEQPRLFPHPRLE